jgi:hypothetical protein
VHTTTEKKNTFTTPEKKTHTFGQKGAEKSRNFLKKYK